MTQFKDHFSQGAQDYAIFRPRYPEDLFAWLATQTDSQLPVWDCACGNGQASVGLASVFRQVFATDASTAQIELAIAHPSIKYSVAPAEQSGLADASVGLICVAQALHWLDLPKFFAECERVLQKQGVLAVWSYGRLSCDDAQLQYMLDAFYEVTVGPYWPAERQWVENGYRDLKLPFAEFHVPDFAMQATWTLTQMAGYLRSWSASRRYIEAVGQDPVAPFIAQLHSLWPTTQLIRWPLALRVSRKS